MAASHLSSSNTGCLNPERFANTFAELDFDQGGLCPQKRIQLSDPRITKLADVLVRYSTKIKPEEWVMVYYHLLAETLAAEVYRAILQAGAHLTAMVDSDLLLYKDGKFVI